MAEFQFDPIEGFENKTSFPNPSTEDQAREQVQSLLDQARNAINQLELLKATKEEVNNVVLGQVPDGSITIPKLSFDPATQAELEEAVGLLIPSTEKGAANGVCDLDASGKFPVARAPVLSYVPNTIAHGITTKTGITLLPKTGAGPYTYTPVTLTIPISTTVEEVELDIGQAHIKLYKGLNYAMVTEDGTDYIKSVNRGYGATFTAASDAAAELMTTSFVSNSTNVKLADAYISGGFIYIKLFTIYAGGSMGPYSETFEYITRG